MHWSVFLYKPSLGRTTDVWHFTVRNGGLNSVLIAGTTPRWPETLL